MDTGLKIVENKRPLQIGEVVYHRKLYDFKESFEVVGITKIAVLLEGDFSGGTHNVTQKDWMPIKGVSRVYNHRFKEEARKQASDIITLAIPCVSDDPTFVAMMDMANAVMVLTNDVSLNPEF